MESFATIVNDFCLLTIVAKLPILDIFGSPGQGSEIRDQRDKSIQNAYIVDFVLASRFNLI